MFSLSYLPTAERLTVVVVKARNLFFPTVRETGDPFVKVKITSIFVIIKFIFLGIFASKWQEGAQKEDVYKEVRKESYFQRGYDF
jgi:hypothetical protein